MQRLPLLLTLAQTLLLTLAPHAVAQVGGRVEEVAHITYAEGYDYFGSSFDAVADLDGDGWGEILVNAPKAAGLEGEVYLYAGRDGSLLHTFTGTPGQASFGMAVAAVPDLDGDGLEDILIGTPTESTVHTYGGSLRVYSGASRTLLYTLHGKYRSHFGSDIAVFEDLDGDGLGDFAVGAPEQDRGEIDRAGAVYLHSGADGSLLAYRRGDRVNQYFGRSIAALGDVDGDGSPELAVGLGNPSIYRGKGVTMLAAADLTEHYTVLPGGRVQDIGAFVAAAGDVDADGIPDLVTHARIGWEVHFMVLSGDDGSLIHLLHHPIQGEDNAFWVSLAGGGDLNHDGHDDILIGRPDADQGPRAEVGTIQVFSGYDGSLIHEEFGQEGHHRLGAQVRAEIDLNGDGLAEMAFSGNSFLLEDLRIQQLDPFLLADRLEVSGASGGTVQLNLAFPVEAAGYRYRILFSATGTGPTLSGVPIPLSMDSWFAHSIQGAYPLSEHAGLGGTLSPHGRATGEFTVPASLPSSLYGTRLWFAATAFPQGQLPAFSSMARTLLITD